MSEEILLIRPQGINENWHLEEWKNKNITVLIPQRNNYDATRLCVESLLRFYPDITILLFDGESRDDSLAYMKWKAVSAPNISIIEMKGIIRGDNTPHGVMLDIAIKRYIHTKYVLIVDNDIIIERSGVIEDMLTQIKSDNLYAIGTLMLVTESGEGCGSPKNESDILRYAHPSFSLYNADVYKTMLEYPMYEHGAPCWLNMKGAKILGYKVGYFPVDKYVSHLSGGSWTSQRTVWKNDFNVNIRPFISFITESEKVFGQLKNQTSNDFEIITALKEVEIKNKKDGHVILHEDMIDVDLMGNIIFSSRFNLHGEYICVLKDESIIENNLVYLTKLKAIELKAPDEFNMGEITFTRRRTFQNKNAFQK